MNAKEIVKFTANEIAILKAIYETGQHEGTQHYMVEDLVSYTGKSVNAIKGILSSLRKKGVIYTYAGECAFDGEIREDAEELFNFAINNVIPENNNIKNNMESQENLMMDERIVRINEITATKLSSVSKGKRESLKAAKVTAKFILDGWDNPDTLRQFVDDEENKVVQYELWCIAKSRVDQLLNEAMEVMNEKCVNEVAENNDDTTSETTPATVETLKTVKNTPKQRTAKSKHEVGDLHPTKDWVWTEYAPGKFDWRTNKHDNPEVNRKERERDPGMNKPKTTKKAAKAKKQAEKPVKVRTIEEILSTKPMGMSVPQERAFKLFRKGYRIDPNAANPQGYTLIKDGKTMVIIEGVMNALLNRMKVTPDEINQFKA